VTNVVRPIFYEGQVLAASDLGDLVDYGRARDERHACFAHRPGILAGLSLELEDAGGRKRAFVKTGTAIDALGRELVLSERTELNADRFKQTIGASADPESWFPVFVRSRFSAQERNPAELAGCQASRGKRVEEKVDAFVGRAGDESTLDASAALLASKPSAALGAGPPILVGFLRWSSTGYFSEVADSSNGVGRTYAGVNASTVASLGNRVLVQLGPTANAGDIAFELDGVERALRFGPLQASGTIGDALLSVDKEGNVTAKGTLKGRAAAGTLHVRTGTASDGLILPLPPGVSEEQVTAGDVTVHVLVSPRIDPALAPTNDPTKHWAAMVRECRVDAQRRLFCQVVWTTLNFSLGAVGDELFSGPAAADFVVIANAKGGAM
jgi:hypothetical protein